MHQFHRQLAAGMRAAVGGSDATLTYLGLTAKEQQLSETIDTGAAGSDAWCVLIHVWTDDTKIPQITLGGTQISPIFTSVSVSALAIRAAVYVVPAQGSVLLQAEALSSPNNSQRVFFYRLTKTIASANDAIENYWGIDNAQTLSLSGVTPGSLVLAFSVNVNNSTIRLASPISEDVFEDTNTNEYASIGTATDVSSVATTEAAPRLLFAMEF
jgi:hypothetical protein